MAKKNEYIADEKKSLSMVLRSLVILAIIVICVSPLILIYTPANKMLVAGVLILLVLVTVFRVFRFRKDTKTQPIFEKLQYKGFDITGKHTFYRTNGKKIKLIYIPLELQNSFEVGGVYEIYYLPNSKVFSKVVNGKLKKNMHNGN